MPSEIALNVATDYESKGIDQAIKGQKDLENHVQKTSKSMDDMGGGFEKVAKKMERPIGHQAFHALAEEVLMSSGAMSGAGQAAGALGAAFSGAGRALMFLGGPIATFGILALGLVAIFEKLSEATNKSAEAIKKDTVELAQEAIERSKDLEALNRHMTMRKDEALGIEKGIDAKKREIQVERDRVEAKLKTLEAAQRSILLGKVEDAQATGSTLQAERNKNIQKEINDQLVKRLSATQALQLIETFQAETTARQIKANSLLSASNERVTDSHMQSFELKEKISYLNQQIADSEISLAQTTDKAQQIIIQAKMAALQKQVEIAQKQLQVNEQAAQKEAQMVQQVSGTFKKFGGDIANNWEWVNDRLVFSTEKAAASIVVSLANAFAESLYLAAARDIFLNPPLAVAELAGAVAIQTAAAGFSALANKPSVSAGPVGGGGTGSKLDSSQANQTQTLTNLYIKIEGGVLDDATAIKVARRIREVVQTRNVTLQGA